MFVVFRPLVSFLLLSVDVELLEGYCGKHSLASTHTKTHSNTPLPRRSTPPLAVCSTAFEASSVLTLVPTKGRHVLLLFCLRSPLLRAGTRVCYSMM